MPFFCVIDFALFAERSLRTRADFSKIRPLTFYPSTPPALKITIMRDSHQWESWKLNNIVFFHCSLPHDCSILCRERKTWLSFLQFTSVQLKMKFKIELQKGNQLGTHSWGTKKSLDYVYHHESLILPLEILCCDATIIFSLWLICCYNYDVLYQNCFSIFLNRYKPCLIRLGWTRFNYNCSIDLRTEMSAMWLLINYSEIIEAFF